MARLHYLITLPSESFGHFCDVADGSQYLRFTRDLDGNDAVLATAEAFEDPDDNTVSLTEYKPRKVHPRGRLAHVFKTTYQSKGVFLKLSWTPVDRMPEGAVYELLRETRVSNVPKVLDSGLLKEDFFGYRLEYLILEDCGMSVDDYLAKKYWDRSNSDSLDQDVMTIVRATLRCLVEARVRGNVLHRDISVGNIMVASNNAGERKGSLTVKVIDWGYAKVLDDVSMDNGDVAITTARKERLAGIASRWRYDSNVVIQNETAHDPLTGTPLYMSIPVLAGAKVRGLADDIESLFYVVMDSLARCGSKKDGDAYG
ncbi:hypothetical protein GGI21_006431, partial [Coemansia aciculifera]